MEKILINTEKILNCGAINNQKVILSEPYIAETENQNINVPELKNEKWIGKIKVSFWNIPIKYEVWTECYITAVVDSAIETEGEIKAFFANIFSFLNEHNIQILQEKLYGLSSMMEKVLNIRDQQFKKSCPDFETPPVTFIEGSPCKNSGIISGIQIIGVITHSEFCQVKTIKNGVLSGKHDFIGKVFKNPLYKEVFLSGISGGREGEHETLINKVNKMFVNSQNLLHIENFKPLDILRTWIYFPRILDWYGEFNKGRNNWFKECGLIKDSAVYLPASTGIQGKRFADEECYMDVLGFISYNSERVNVTPMKNIRQNEAKEYGSSFSRGMAVKVDGISTLYISGTASINNNGKTVYYDDPQGQILETLLDIAALLDTEKSKLKEIVLATAYCKNIETFENFKNITKSLEFEDIPFLPVFADVCRNELLFETDCIAINQRFSG